MKKMKAFMLGMREFGSDFTTNCQEAEAYDRGREVAHCMTLLQFETA